MGHHSTNASSSAASQLAWICLRLQPSKYNLDPETKRIPIQLKGLSEHVDASPGETEPHLPGKAPQHLNFWHSSQSKHQPQKWLEISQHIRLQPMKAHAAKYSLGGSSSHHRAFPLLLSLHLWISAHTCGSRSFHPSYSHHPSRWASLMSISQPSLMIPYCVSSSYTFYWCSQPIAPCGI